MGMRWSTRFSNLKLKTWMTYLFLLVNLIIIKQSSCQDLTGHQVYSKKNNSLVEVDLFKSQSNGTLNATTSHPLVRIHKNILATSSTGQSYFSQYAPLLKFYFDSWKRFSPALVTLKKDGSLNTPNAPKFLNIPNALSALSEASSSSLEVIHPEIESSIEWLDSIHLKKQTSQQAPHMTGHFLVVLHEIPVASENTSASNNATNQDSKMIVVAGSVDFGAQPAQKQLLVRTSSQRRIPELSDVSAETISASSHSQQDQYQLHHERADKLARKHDLKNLGQVKQHPYHYHFVLPIPKITKNTNTNRNGKDGIASETENAQSDSNATIVKNAVNVMSSPTTVTEQISFTKSIKDTLDKLKNDPEIRDVIHQHGFVRQKRGYKALELKLPNVNTVKDPSDPLFTSQWYLKNTGQNGGKPYLDLNVESAWAQGCTGKNVTTAIMDDGVDYTHPDLKDNYNAKASYDFSSNDPYPYPRYTDDWFNSHGTRCAGEISAKRNNGICGVGIAYDSLIAGIRMLDQPYMTDLIEANSMGHEPNLIDIYSASWGPTDDGKTVDGPRNLTMRAIVKGVNEGRRGLGNIYVWASGDGGKNDDCNCDGYAASMWTISINSAINTGENARYDESCSSTLASTFSNGGKNPNSGVATTDLYGKCTKTHSGTSAAAPEAAGVFALALEANPKLTWRDIQHLTVFTSKRNSLYDSRGEFPWTMNGVGLEFNHLFGYGVLDAGAMVALAKEWNSVPPRFHCEAGIVKKSHIIPSDGSLRLYIDTDSCFDTPNEVNFLEHVQCIVTLNSTRRGDVTIFLISPSGTRSMVLSRRPNDADSKDGFYKWPFMTTHTWGENPRGRWIMEISFKGPDRQSGQISQWTLLLHGTKDSPYEHQIITDPKSKLAIAKKAHDLQTRRKRKKR